MAGCERKSHVSLQPWQHHVSKQGTGSTHLDGDLSDLGGAVGSWWRRGRLSCKRLLRQGRQGRPGLRGVQLGLCHLLLQEGVQEVAGHAPAHQQQWAAGQGRRCQRWKDGPRTLTCPGRGWRPAAGSGPPLQSPETRGRPQGLRTPAEAAAPGAARRQGGAQAPEGCPATGAWARSGARLRLQRPWTALK